MESTLSLKLADIQARLGVFAGWGRGAAFGESAWSTKQQAVIEDATQSGLRRFYFPEPGEGQENSYSWSFLRPTATLTLVSGKNTIPLPDDFGSFEGQISVSTSGSASQPWRIDWTSEPSLRQMYSTNPSMTGPPRCAAEAPLRGTTAIAGQRSQLLLFPLADKDYVLQVQYYLSPDYLTGASPYAYGGAPHVETILESCLAVMEERVDDQKTVHAVAFSRRLMASISMDRRNKPQKLGYNGDRSDLCGWDRGSVHYSAPAATYAGNPFN